MKRPIRQVMFIYGHSGNGKNSIISSFCNEHEITTMTIDPSSYNESDKAITEISNAINSGSLEAGVKGIKIIIIDGIQFFDKKTTKKVWSLIKESQQPMILIGDQRQDIHYQQRRSTLEVEIKRPLQGDIIGHLNKIKQLENLNVKDRHLHLICKASLSVRSAVANLQYLSLGSITPDDLHEKIKLMNPEEQVSLLLRGKNPHITLKPDELQTWILDNGGNPDMVAMADVFTGRAMHNQNYKFWKYAYKILSQCRSSRNVKYPRMYSQMYKAKVHNQKVKSEKIKVLKKNKMAKKKEHPIDGLDEFF